MKFIFSIVALLVGIVGINVSYFKREVNEKQAFENFFQDQRQNLLEQWNQKWLAYLTRNIVVEDDAAGLLQIIEKPISQLKTEFYPQSSKKNVNWQNLETLNENQQKEFLLNVLSDVGTWERAMALKKWHQKFGKWPQDLQLSFYEQSLFNHEIAVMFQSAEKLIFSRETLTQMNKGVQFDRIFFEIKETSTIFYLPSTSYLQELLTKFQLEMNLKHLKLTSDYKITMANDLLPFDIKNKETEIYFMFGIFFVLMGILIFLYDLWQRKNTLDHKISFMNQLIHELKTPATGIQLNAETLMKHGYDEEIVQALLRSTKRLHSFFEDVMIVNHQLQTQNEKKLYSAEEFKLYLNTIFDEFRGKISMDFQTNETIYIDESRLRMILRNVAKNAIKYGKRAHCIVKNEQEYLYISLQDEGEGISLSESKKVFQNFFRGKNAHLIAPDGLGMGLAIVERLANEAHYLVKLENPGEKRARFSIRIPRHV